MPSRRAPIRGPHSRQHHETRLVPFTPQQLYAVVSDVGAYHKFVPWCTASTLTRHLDEQQVVADLAVGFRLLSERYTSVITLDPGRAVSVDVLHSSLFDYLINDWALHPALTSPSTPPATNLAFYVEFAFRNPIYQRVTDLFFEDVVKQMVSAFERECHRRHGPADVHNLVQQHHQQHHQQLERDREQRRCVAPPFNSDRHLLHRW